MQAYKDSLIDFAFPLFIAEHEVFGYMKDKVYLHFRETQRLDFLGVLLQGQGFCFWVEVESVVS